MVAAFDEGPVLIFLGQFDANVIDVRQNVVDIFGRMQIHRETITVFTVKLVDLNI